MLDVFVLNRAKIKSSQKINILKISKLNNFTINYLGNFLLILGKKLSSHI